MLVAVSQACCGCQCTNLQLATQGLVDPVTSLSSIIYSTAFFVEADVDQMQCVAHDASAASYIPFSVGRRLQGLWLGPGLGIVLLVANIGLLVIQIPFVICTWIC